MNELQIQKKSTTDSIAVVEPSQVATIREALTANLPNIRTIRADKTAKDGMFRIIFTHTRRFLELMDVDADKAKMIAEAFGTDVLDCRDDWNEADVVMFFKTIRQRQDIEDFSFKFRKINIVTLNEMAAAYDGVRADERALLRRAQPIKAALVVQSVSDETVNKYLAMMEETLQNKLNRGKGSTFTRAIETQQWHKDNEAKAQELRGKVDAGELTEDEALKQYDEYFLRK